MEIMQKQKQNLVLRNIMRRMHKVVPYIVKRLSIYARMKMSILWEIMCKQKPMRLLPLWVELYMARMYIYAAMITSFFHLIMKCMPIGID